MDLSLSNKGKNAAFLMGLGVVEQDANHIASLIAADAVWVSIVNPNDETQREVANIIDLINKKEKREIVTPGVLIVCPTVNFITPCRLKNVEKPICLLSVDKQFSSTMTKDEKEEWWVDIIHELYHMQDDRLFDDGEMKRREFRADLGVAKMGFGQAMIWRLYKSLQEKGYEVERGGRIDYAGCQEVLNMLRAEDPEHPNELSRIAFLEAYLKLKTEDERKRFVDRVMNKESMEDRVRRIKVAQVAKEKNGDKRGRVW